MAFRNNCYATVWEVRPGTKFDGSPAAFTEVRLTTSRKKPQTNPPEYETDYSGFVRFIGEAHKMAAGLKERDRIQLGDVAVSGGVWNKERQKATAYTYQCFSFAPAEATSTASAQTHQKYDNSDIPSGTTDEELPFN